MAGDAVLVHEGTESFHVLLCALPFGAIVDTLLEIVNLNIRHGSIPERGEISISRRIAADGRGAGLVRREPFVIQGLERIDGLFLSAGERRQRGPCLFARVKGPGCGLAFEFAVLPWVIAEGLDSLVSSVFLFYDRAGAVGPAPPRLFPDQLCAAPGTERGAVHYLLPAFLT